GELGGPGEGVLGGWGDDSAAGRDVGWMDRPAVDERQRPPTLRVAPLDVGGLLAERVFRPRTVVLTSATLAVGGSFEPLARQWGLPGEGQGGAGPAGGEPAAGATRGAGEEAGGEDAAAGRHRLAWSGRDVGSPFDHPRSAILYVARHLPPPGRDGLPAAYLTELRELIAAAGGRTLGLFSSMRAARQA